MNNYLNLLLSFLFLPFISYGQNVKDIVTQFSNQKGISTANVGVYAIDSQSGKILVNYQGHKGFATASLMKLITTATVLEQKGADYRYETPVFYSKHLKQGVIEGNLYIKGSGDPTFSSSHFMQNNILNSVSNLLKNKRVKAVKGDIILDLSMFEMEVPRTWIWEDIANYYGASVSPINYKDNLYYLYFKTGKAGTKAQLLRTFPIQNLQFENEVYASTLNQDQAYIFGAPMSDKRLVKGTLPQYRKRYAIKGAMSNPALTFGRELRNELKARGISITGEIKIKNSTPMEEVKWLGTLYSPSLREIIKLTNQKSLNLYAEALLYLVEGTETMERKELLEAVKTFWRKNKLNTEAIHLHDGSGLSHFNTVSPLFFVQLLQFMNKSEYSEVFRNSLAVSGKTGTLLWLGKGSTLDGRVLGKSGTMQQVTGYAGYLTANSGKEIIFAIMVNNAQDSSGEVRRKIAKMLQSW